MEDYDEFIESLSKGNMDGYIMGMIDFYEEYFDLGGMINHIREFGIGGIPPIGKIEKICEEENTIHIEDFNKNSVKKVLKRVVKHMDE